MAVSANFNVILPQGKVNTNDWIKQKFSDAPSSTSKKIAKDVLKSMDTYAKKLKTQGKIDVLYDTTSKGVEIIQNCSKFATPSKIREYRKSRTTLLIAGLTTLLASICLTTLTMLWGFLPIAAIGALGMLAGTAVLLATLSKHLSYKKEIDKMAHTAVDLYHCIAQQCTNKTGGSLSSTLNGNISGSDLNNEKNTFIDDVAKRSLTQMLPA